MTTIGLIREGKVPSDNRVALTPAQCKWLRLHRPEIRILVQPSPLRCFSDKEYEHAGISVQEDLNSCQILLGIKEVPRNELLEGKTYLFFSHTKKLQPYNQLMFQEILHKKITLIDYECMEHPDGKRIIGFGFFAGIVGAHNGMRAFGQRTGSFRLDAVSKSKNLQQLVHTYFGLRLPNIKIAVTGSGRVAHGILEIMNLMGITEVEPDEYKQNTFSYPAYVHLKGANLYARKSDSGYNRLEFHQHPELYHCLFNQFLPHTDILMNGVYWETGIPRLFEQADLDTPDFRIQTIADITDDKGGSVPCNLGDSSINAPVYGVDRKTGTRTEPYLPGSVDVMAVGNLPNELPRDASRYFGEQFIKFVLADLVLDTPTPMIEKATLVCQGKITPDYAYMNAYGGVSA